MRAAILGGGVIGGGWAARFLLMGWDVRVFDPDPEAERKVGEVIANARASLPGLTDGPMPQEGRLSFHATISEAVEGAAWVQESVPERLELKRKVYQTAQAHMGQDAILGSSTSGFKPSELQGCASAPGQIVVTHPFNPVYLLPLIELVTTEANSTATIARAKEILSGIGCHPLHLRKEIDAHIADRFLEAVWREALWLIKDGIATTEEIDDAIRYGFGLRWAQMGLFETYRIAGGEAGMRHFIAQFGPCLAWPWTKLMDVPELTEDLIDAIADQSDAQSGAHSIRELERIRDANLVTMMRGLKARDWGAGAILNAQERRMPGPPRRIEEIEDIIVPVLTVARAVPLDWTDYNGHMNEARYLQVFGDATDRFMAIVGCDESYIASGSSYFTAETHIRHLDEALAGQRIRVETQCLDGAGKRMHLFHRMWEGERLIATGEHMLIHVSLKTRKSSVPGPVVAERLGRVAEAHGALPTPDGAGAAIGRR
ncbi:carnitine 3-dehydrogenase [Ponticoccus sp. SC2-23]|uniref:carnitine 3-dehydrogenase n=1 Tax=Alexandriicola marinus TaxID=2081710 RepID=UPI000FD864C4|nr:carnitine 3-dehydrogenase [Alexandriicola marinus]MBM1221195.1 carnitine 3-dehydrogenase [Ponticoccus sp. SC6-9]MBM1225765.1 carnitine 3-dehydrogenase [Ponticoccus sp. SC6-15]MBM1227917.1 carnitine 3-dehydrogenase [Ponticoccus sp. SC6-38]MBM1234445.1 carnitine 3-dehydrogenase [Ponticoccus sp. SC6-45]MBM1238419.1 carnitine 3-dehydrogenase [Ponticoccus sp. SC6-49]MBM1243688.1 carnitine 3-dehydrogenase [Ponticoccus sp. SC2-64]MBM1247969.1 carnitine 3-dehydrogenase [Ponticoccus sp. SC6-42]MB